MDNLQYIIQAILQNPNIPGGVYHLADDDAVSTNELIELIGQARGGKKPTQWRIPTGVVRGLAQLGDNLGLLLNTERLDKLTENYVVSNSKIKSALGIERLCNPS